MSSVFIVIAVIIVVLVLFSRYRKRKQQRDLVEKALQNMQSEEFMASVRKIICSNDFDTSVNMTFTLMSDGEEPFVQEHVLPAHDSGWIPYCVPGILQVTYQGQSAQVDITDTACEYVVTISADNELKVYSQERSD